jgi:type II secretory pathway pseudopilin PulG
MEEFAKLAAGVLATLLSALAAIAVPMAVQYIRKLGLQISAEQEAQIRSTAEGAVLRAEEIIEAQIKTHGTPIVRSGADKLEIAATAIMEKVPGVTKPEAEGLAKEAVARVGLGATDLAGKLAAASRTS